VTVVSPLAASYVDRAATADAGTVADGGFRKTEKYSSLSSMYMFVPVAVENLGALISSTLDFLMGRRICSQSGDVRESLYLFQRISVAIQRFNSVLLQSTYRTYSHPAFCFYLPFLTPGILTTWGVKKLIY